MANLSKLKKISESINVQYLLKEYVQELENEQRIKELGKGKISLIICRKEEDKKEVIATPFLNGIFAFHKDAFTSGYTITHTANGEPLVRACDQKDVKAAVAYLIAELPSEALIDAHNPDGAIFMRAQRPEVLDKLRAANKIAKGVPLNMQ